MGIPDGKFRLSVFFDVLILSVVLNLFWIVRSGDFFWWFFRGESAAGDASVAWGSVFCVALELHS